MTTTVNKHERNLSAIIHAATFSKYIIPFGNFILPLLLWTANRKTYDFVDHNGKEALNFQISLLLYGIVAGLFTIPFVIGLWPNIFDFGFGGFFDMLDRGTPSFRFDSNHFNWGLWLIPVGISGLIHGFLFVLNVVYTILATIRTSEGVRFTYPLTIKFLK
ncbi:MAG: DUF4870 domain-containing protein [Bacteroidota bacterium]